MHGRTRRYLISMGIRTVCLVLAIFVAHGWLRLIFIAAAIVLPWVAVVLANAGPVQNAEQPEFIGGGQRELRPGASEVDASADPDDETRPPGRTDMGNASATDSGASVADNVPDGERTSSETMAGRHHGAG